MPSIVKVNEISSTNAAVTPVTVKSHMDLETTKDILNARDITVSRDVTITGNLTVNGSTSVIQTDTLQVKDKNIELAISNSPTDALADGGGITLKGTTDKTFNWVDSTDSWTSSEHINLASGKEFKINGTTVLSSSQILSKSLPTGTIVGTSDSQTLTNKTLETFSLSGDINLTGAFDIDLLDNNSSALSFDTIGKTGILEIDTTDGAEKVKMSGGLEVSEHLNIASGKEFRINGTLVLSSTQVLSTTRQTNALANDGTVSISTLFGSQISGSYRFFDLNDPRISGTVFLKHNGPSSEPDVRVDSNSSTVSITINTASSLNVYISSNVVTFQNKTGSAISLVVYREV